MISVRSAGRVSVCGQNLNFAIFSDTINTINVKLCIMVVQIELYQFILLSVTFVVFQGLESQGCHLSSFCYLLSCFSAKSYYSFCLFFFFFPACWPILLIFFLPENSSTFFVKMCVCVCLCVSVCVCVCMAPVQQLGEVSLSVVCAACCYMALEFGLTHLCNIEKNCFGPFLFLNPLKKKIWY